MVGFWSWEFFAGAFLILGMLAALLMRSGDTSMAAEGRDKWRDFFDRLRLRIAMAYVALFSKTVVVIGAADMSDLVEEGGGSFMAYSGTEDDVAALLDQNAFEFRASLNAARYGRKA